MNGREGALLSSWNFFKSLGHSYCCYSIVRRALILISTPQYSWLIVSSFCLFDSVPKTRMINILQECSQSLLLRKNNETVDFKEALEGLESTDLNPDGIFHLVWFFLLHTCYILSIYYLTVAFIRAIAICV